MHEHDSHNKIISSIVHNMSTFISVINQLDAQNLLFYSKFISCLYMFRAHVLETYRGMK